MSERTTGCPCDTCSVVKELHEDVEKQHEKIIDCQIKFASINSKLNVVLGILSAIGVAIIGIIANALSLF